MSSTSAFALRTSSSPPRRPRSLGRTELVGHRRRSARGALGLRSLWAAGRLGAAALDGRRRRLAAAGGADASAGLEDLEALVAHAGDDDRDVAGALADARRPATGAGGSGAASGPRRRSRRARTARRRPARRCARRWRRRWRAPCGRRWRRHARGELQHLVGAADVEAADQVEHRLGGALLADDRTYFGRRWPSVPGAPRPCGAVAPSLSFGPFISGDPSRPSPGRRGTGRCASG